MKRKLVAINSRPLLELQSVSRFYPQGGGRRAAVDGVSLRVYPAEFVALLGPSGSGKTTLLNLAAGLDRPDQGSVLFETRRLDSLSDGTRSRLRRRRMGFIFQSFQLLPHLNALENVLLPARLDHRDIKAARQRAMDLIGRLGLRGREGDFPSQLSAGEQQRVAVARALINEPRVVLGDEPSGNLHRQASLDLFRLFAGLARQEGVAFLVATHNLEIRRFAARTMGVADGKLA